MSGEQRVTPQKPFLSCFSMWKAEQYKRLAYSNSRLQFINLLKQHVYCRLKVIQLGCGLYSTFVTHPANKLCNINYLFSIRIWSRDVSIDTLKMIVTITDVMCETVFVSTVSWQQTSGAFNDQVICFICVNTNLWRFLTFDISGSSWCSWFYFRFCGLAPRTGHR